MPTSVLGSRSNELTRGRCLEQRLVQRKHKMHGPPPAPGTPSRGSSDGTGGEIHSPQASGSSTRVHRLPGFRGCESCPHTNGKTVAKTQPRGLNTTKTQGPETLAFPSFSVTRWVPVFRVWKHGTAHLPEEFSRMNS